MQNTYKGESMKNNQTDWSAIANSPKFIELQRKKKLFMFSWWGIGSLSYFILLLGAAYTPEIFRIKVIGKINFGYLLCLFQFFLAWAMAILYAYKANSDFDPLTEEILAEIERGGK